MHSVQRIELQLLLLPEVGWGPWADSLEGAIPAQSKEE